VPGAICAHCEYEHGEQRRDRQGQPRVYKTGKNKGQPMIVSLTINHKDRESYRTFEDYLIWDPITMEICCVSCNRRWEKGEIICPVCKVNYIHWSADPQMCRDCREEANPVLRQIREIRQATQEEIDRVHRNKRNQKRRQKANPHPCDRHSKQSVKCLWPGYGACDQNRANASKNKCGHFKVRKAPV
jgi:hypothetical protein